MVTITKVEKAARKVTAVDDFGSTFLFHYSSETRIRLAALQGGTLDLRVEAVTSRLTVGHRFAVKWKPDASGHKRMAVLFTPR